MRELELLDALWEIITPVTGLGELGPGDDAALIPLDGAAVVSVDQTVSGVHADSEFVTPADFGWRAVATALSDLAAMGCEANAVLIGLTYPPDFTAEDMKALAEGANSATTEAGARIFGGDVSTGPTLSAAVTVIGSAPTGLEPVTRSGAKVGDRVGVTGTLGASAGGLELLRAAATDPDGYRYRRPSALIAEGIALAGAGVSSMIDISDGIATDAGHIGRASNVSLAIDLELLPVDPICRRAAELLGVPAADLAATGGEDFELLFTAPTAAMELIENSVQRPVSWIGDVVEGDPGVALNKQGLSGWEH
jgi:thiamine-monophosphate kinase